MLSTYVQADEIIQVVDPVNIFEREAFEKEVDHARTPRAKADVIANRTKKTIAEKMEEDPFLYRKFSALLQQAIEDYRAKRLDEAQYLARVMEIMEQVRDGKRDDTPAVLHQSDLAKAFFGALKEQVPEDENRAGSAHDDQSPYDEQIPSSKPQASLPELLAAVACDIERIIRKHAIVRWRENLDAQNHMRNDLDDLLFNLQHENGIRFSLTQMDAIIESILRIARNRQDV
jgi:type I restriction enzyme, R subunit